MNEVQEEDDHEVFLDTEDTPAIPAEDAMPAAPEPAMPPSTEELRMRPIRECRRLALADPEPLLASVGSLNGGLLQIGHHLEEAILQTLASGNDTDARLNKVLPAIDTHLRLSRQVDRFTQLALRTAALRRELARNVTGGGPNPTQPFPGQPFGKAKF